MRCMPPPLDIGQSSGGNLATSLQQLCGTFPVCHARSSVGGQDGKPGEAFASVGWVMSRQPFNAWYYPRERWEKTSRTNVSRET